MAKRKPGESLLDAVDKFAMALLDEASSTKVPSENSDADDAEDGEPGVATLDDRVAVLSAITRWVATKHRIKPESDDDDWLSKSRRELNSANRGTARRRTGGDAAPAGQAPASGNGSGAAPGSGTGAD